MILISLQPFTPKKVLALAAAIVCLARITSFGSPILLPVDSTPYDGQMSRIREVLAQRTRGERQLSLRLVNQWMENLREIPYSYDAKWETPAEVTAREAADCKGKAVALYRKMRTHGAGNLRLVIGQRLRASRFTHTWLVWRTRNDSYLLDPTIYCSARSTKEIGDGCYIPHYAFSDSQKYRATALALVAQN